MHGTCVTNPTGSYCQCKPGFTGALCDEDINECTGNVCPGACTNTIGSFTCECPEGFTGPGCQHRKFQKLGLGYVYGLSRDGTHVVGSQKFKSDSNPRGVTHALVYDLAKDTVFDIGPTDPPTDVPHCEATVVNGDGSVVVGVCGADLQPAIGWPGKSFIWRDGQTKFLEGELAAAIITSMSADGNVLVGVHGRYPELTAFRATPTSFQDLVETIGDAQGNAFVSVSADGSIVGLSVDGYKPMAWSSRYGLRRLAGEALGPQRSVLVSSDGSTFVGAADITLLFDRGWLINGKGARWRGAHVEEILPGARVCSGDGSVVAGYSTDGGEFLDFDGIDRYPEFMALLPSTATRAGIVAVSDDGKVFVGDGVGPYVVHLP